MSRRSTAARGMRNEATIQSRALTPDGGGGGAAVWSTFASIWCRVEPVSASEAFRAGQLQGSISHRVTTRYVAGTKPSMRVLLTQGSRVFEVVGVRDADETQRLMILDCVEERT